MSVRVVLVDDQPLVRAGVAALLEGAPGVEIVGEAADGRAGLSIVRQVVPDVVLMDLRMPVLDGLEATRGIVADPALASVEVVVLTTFDGDEEVLEAIRAGASGYLLKDFQPHELRTAIATVAAGGSLLAPDVARRLLRRLADEPVPRPRDPRIESLTGREREVLRHVGLGETNEEIARSLHLSPATARTYVSRLLARLDARDRSRLVILAYEHGIVRVGEGGG
ncbi:response regulator [Agromyces aurantiacus]|uniref:Response regulator n=1 Tax=Agromyces aurantiacus TaxID=165814 RepID=A0ABV9R7J9_9MICO|nr:response regulator transcription factor [Agromyces aurantiacus]MBM7505140.1 DNA-binding NarL/FixJ family response regulator [Agromyces aurantiacus]